MKVEEGREKRESSEKWIRGKTRKGREVVRKRQVGRYVGREGREAASNQQHF